MSKFKSLISNLYNRYMDEVDDYEELEDEYVETDLKEEAEYRAKRAERERRRQTEEDLFDSERKELPDVMRHPEIEEPVSNKVHLYDYTKEGKMCCHCDSSLDKGVTSEKDQWGMSYMICPSCQFVNRIEPNGQPVYPSSEVEEMEHALSLFAKKGHVFKGFNQKAE